MDDPKFNHLDFVIHDQAHILVYQRVIEFFGGQPTSPRTSHTSSNRAAAAEDPVKILIEPDADLVD